MIAYCDFIADRIRNAMLTSLTNVLEPIQLKSVSKVEYDLTPTGKFNSTKKTLYVWDAYGKEYRVTVEEV